MSKEIKPCPFCGENRIQINHIGGRGCAIECTHCRAKSRYWEREDTAINSWNRRAKSSELTALREFKERITNLFRQEYLDMDMDIAKATQDGDVRAAYIIKVWKENWEEIAAALGIDLQEGEDDETA